MELECGEARGWILARGCWRAERAPAPLTAALEWMRCSDGCLNRLIGLASPEIGTDGWMERGRREREEKSVGKQRAG